MKLPLLLDKTPSGKLVQRTDIGEPGYAENIEYQLEIGRKGDFITIQYYGEDDTSLTYDEVLYVMNNWKKFAD